MEQNSDSQAVGGTSWEPGLICLRDNWGRFKSPAHQATRTAFFLEIVGGAMERIGVPQETCDGYRLSLISQAEGSSQGACGSYSGKKLLWETELCLAIPRGFFASTISLSKGCRCLGSRLKPFLLPCMLKCACLLCASTSCA